jgi:hypothetical protein
MRISALYNFPICCLILYVIGGSFLPNHFIVPFVCSQEIPHNSDESVKTVISFNEKLRYYLNENTQTLIEELLARETEVIQLVKNIQKEITLRGKEKFKSNEPGFKSIYNKKDSLTEAYDAELTKLISVYDDLQKLAKIAKYSGDLENLSQVLYSKDHLFMVIDEREFYKKGIYDSEHINDMIYEYSSELDSILNIYDSLEHIQLTAENRNDQRAMQSIDDQKTRIIKILSKWGTIGPLSEESIVKYKDEMQNVQAVLQEARNLQKAHINAESSQIQQVRENLVQKVDKTMSELLVQENYSLPTDPTVMEFIKAWKAARLADINIRIFEYQFLWKNLLKSADESEHERMFSAEVSNAMLNYSEGRYLVAEYQFMSILNEYRDQYTHLYPIQFFIGECRYQRSSYEQAKEIFQSLINTADFTAYKSQCLIRLMQYEDKYGTFDSLLLYYSQLLQNENLVPNELLSYAHYLAAKNYFKKNLYDDCARVLVQIPIHSVFYYQAQFFLAIVYTNQGKFEQAIVIFKQFIPEQHRFWSDLKSPEYCYDALLRLGLLYYQKGEYDSALASLQKISPEFDKFDEILIVQAWSYYQLGKYQLAIEKSKELVDRFVTSQFTYEALVLSAHCAEMLDNPQEAMDSYRYVLHAKKASNVEKQYDKEFENTINQIKENNRIEETMLDNRREDIYSVVSHLQQQLNERFLQVKERGTRASELLKDDSDERINVMNHIFKLDEIIQWGQKSKQENIVKSAVNQRERLLKVLETFQKNKMASNYSLIFDFPLVVKESVSDLKSQNYTAILRDLNLEKQRIADYLAQNSLQQTGNSDAGAKLDLLVIEMDIKNLSERIEKLQKALHETQSYSVDSQLNRWNEFSGYGIADIIHKERKAKLLLINQYAEQINVINGMLERQQGQMKQQLDDYEDELKNLRDQLLARKVQLEQLEHKKYILEYYYDHKDQEQETREDRLLQLEDQK